MDDNFFALGGHSLLALQLVSACQVAIRQFRQFRQFGQFGQSSPSGLAALADKLSLRDLLAQPSFAGMAAALGGTDLTTGQTRPALPHPLVALRPSGTRPPLFCVHPQSGTAWCYAELVRHLPLEVPVYGLHALGLQDGEQALHSVPAMAAAYLQALRQVQPQGPYQLMGYSSGGVAAYEMALQLRAAGQVVSLLVLRDSPLPNGSDVRPHTDADVLDNDSRVLGLTDAAHMPRHAADLLALLQVRALQREGALTDWACRVPATTLRTHTLDTDHTGLVGAPWAAEVARLVAPGLA